MAPEKIETDGEGKENRAADGREAARVSGSGWPERRRAEAVAAARGGGGGGGVPARIEGEPSCSCVPIFFCSLVRPKPIHKTFSL